MYNICAKVDNKWRCSLEETLIMFSRLNINNIEIDDQIDTIDLIDMDGELIEKYRNLLIQYNKKIVLLNSSLAVSNVENYHLLFRKALFLMVECIRITINTNDMGLMPLEEIEIILKMAKSYNIRCMIENDSPVFNDFTQTQLVNLLKQYDLGLIFNPLEIVKGKRHPFFHMFYHCKFKNSIHFLRINDGLFHDGTPVKPGNGNAEIRELISALIVRNYRGYFSVDSYLEPCNVGNIHETLSILKEILMTI